MLQGRHGLSSTTPARACCPPSRKARHWPSQQVQQQGLAQPCTAQGSAALPPARRPLCCDGEAPRSPAPVGGSGAPRCFCCCFDCCQQAGAWRCRCKGGCEGPTVSRHEITCACAWACVGFFCSAPPSTMLARHASSNCVSTRRSVLIAGGMHGWHSAGAHVYCPPNRLSASQTLSEHWRRVRTLWMLAKNGKTAKS